MTGTIHVFIGTKAQYIKTAPLLRLMDTEGVSYRLIDSGQHGRLASGLRTELQVREPDVLLGSDRDVTSIPQAIGWSLKLASRLGSHRGVLQDVFGGDGGVCVVHGDTPSTLLATLMGRRAGLRVAHLEAGLRSHRLTHPFPEELIRVIVMKRSDILFAPDDVAAKNLADLHVRGRVVHTSGNTSLEALEYSLGREPRPGSGPAVVTSHRVENLHHPRRLHLLVEVVERIADTHEVVFVLHDPTAATLAKSGADERLRRTGVALMPLASHREFVGLLADAPFVITDGGSVQEECAILGVPTLLWRDRTERPDGVGDNVVVSGYDESQVASFLSNPERYRRPFRRPAVRPSEKILDELLREVSQ